MLWGKKITVAGDHSMWQLCVNSSNMQCAASVSYTAMFAAGAFKIIVSIAAENNNRNNTKNQLASTYAQFEKEAKQLNSRKINRNDTKNQLAYLLNNNI